MAQLWRGRASDHEAFFCEAFFCVVAGLLNFRQSQCMERVGSLERVGSMKLVG